MGAGQTFSYFLLAHIIRHQPTHDLRSTVYDHDGYLLEREREMEEEEGGSWLRPWKPFELGLENNAGW